MLQIWGRDNSVNVQKVLWCCDELGIEYRRIDAGGPFGVVNTPEYRRLNPNGLVPTVIDDGFVLWESNAIVRYLGSKHDQGTLWPNDPRTRANGDRWMDWMLTTFWPTMRPLFLGLVRTPPEQRDARALEEMRVKAAETLKMADAHLETHRFLAGESFTLCDIPLGAGVWRWMALPIERPPTPNLERWFNALTERPSYRKIVMQPLS